MLDDKILAAASAPDEELAVPPFRSVAEAPLETLAETHKRNVKR
jgi:hypothetical protein